MMKINQYLLPLLLWLFILPHPGIGLSNSDITLDAESIDFNGSQSTIIASGNVKIQYKDVSIKSQNAIYSHIDRIIKLNGKVNLQKDQFKLNCEKLVADLNTKQVFAQNGVVFSLDKDIHGQADTATYYMEKNSVHLSGNTIVTRGTDRLTGPEVVILLNEKRVVTKGRTSITISPEGYQ